jgi:2-(1,2-epoxy-1,2-dihydrophenyl)acetyl-CoA isomerase
MYRTILFETESGIATVTLNRPEVLNAYTPEMGEEVVDAFRRIENDSAIRVVILTGAGRGFCSGVDLEQLMRVQAGEEAPQGEGPRLGEESFIREFPLELATFPKPVIAAINGAAIGVGVTLTLLCDIRIAADTAKLGLTFTKLGILPGLGSTHLLPRIVGMAKALELVLTARVIDALEAAEIGLVNRVVPANSLTHEVRELAQGLMENLPDALSRAKRALHYGATATMEQAMRNEEAQSVALRASRPSHRNAAAKNGHST